MFVTTLNAIDEAINQSPQIVERYEQQINETRQQYQQASQPEKKYELAFQLYELNKSFMNDSAIYYLNEAERWAEKMGNKALAGNCCALKAFQCSTVGYYNEALVFLSRIDKHQLDSVGFVFSGATLFITSVSYSLQLFFDFAGYSNMAIGVATILGFDISANFNLPYMATNPSEFWNRWHISLSSWLKEYVYIPLGGNRKGIARTYINILLVMIVSGLWHGSTINFLIWGILHGVGQMVHRAVFGKRKDAKSNGAVRILSMILNFLFVNFLWIPFRAKTLSDTWTIIKRIATFAEGASYFYVYTFIFGIMLIIVQFIGAKFNNGNDPIRPLPFDKFYAKVIFCALIIATAMFAYFGSGAFIYSQF